MALLSILNPITTYDLVFQQPYGVVIEFIDGLVRLLNTSQCAILLVLGLGNSRGYKTRHSC